MNRKTNDPDSVGRLTRDWSGPPKSAAVQRQAVESNYGFGELIGKPLSVPHLRSPIYGNGFGELIMKLLSVPHLRQLVEVDRTAEDGFGLAISISGEVVHALFFGTAKGAGLSGGHGRAVQ